MGVKKIHRRPLFTSIDSITLWSMWWLAQSCGFRLIIILPVFKSLPKNRLLFNRHLYGDSFYQIYKRKAISFKKIWQHDKFIHSFKELACTVRFHFSSGLRWCSTDQRVGRCRGFIVWRKCSLQRRSNTNRPSSSSAWKYWTTLSPCGT